MITSRIDNIITLSNDDLKEILPAPKSVKIELCSICNQKCKFCAVKNNLRDKSSMNFELFKKIVTECENAGVEEVGLFYLGESTLYSKLIDAIKYCKSIGINYVFLTTNGLSIDFDLAKDLVLSGLDSLKFSFNFYSVDDYLNNAGVNGFRVVLNNLKTIRMLRDEFKSNLKIYASSIERDNEVDQNNLTLIINEHVKPLVDEHYWLPLYNQASYCRTNKYYGNRGRLDNLVPEIPCWGIFKKPNITFDGLMTLCCFDFKNNFICGDLKSQTFMDCWNSEIAQNLRREHINKCISNEICKKCLGLK